MHNLIDKFIYIVLFVAVDDENTRASDEIDNGIWDRGNDTRKD